MFAEPLAEAAWRRGGHVLAIEEERLVGAISYAPGADDDEARFRIGNLAVEVPCARSGVLAYGLMVAAYDRVVALGAASVNLHLHGPRHRLRRHYERLGFELARTGAEGCVFRLRVPPSKFFSRVRKRFRPTSIRANEDSESSD